MNHLRAPGASLQRAALTLHAVSQPDRAWLLAALPPLQREVLAPLLAELEALGIPREPELLSDVPETAVAARASWPKQLDEGEIDAVSDVLRHEPASLTHALLAMQPWDWTPRFLSALHASRRAQVEGSAHVPGPRLQEAILQALKSQIHVDRPAPAVPRDRGRNFARAAWTAVWRRA
jgi:hypothetical protein